MMKRRIINSVLITSLLFLSIPAQSQKKKFSPEVNAKIAQVEQNLASWIQTGDNDRWNIVERMMKYNVKGVSIAVIHNYKIEWAKGYGFSDVEERREVSERTQFQAASISKSINSLGILKLVQEKKIDLDADINNYLVSWKFPYDEKSGNRIISVRDILSHTAGLSVSGFPGYRKNDSLPSVIQILDGMPPSNTSPVRSLIEPGQKFVYSGGGITISQLIAMDITHKPYDVYMKDAVLSPLKMNNSSFRQPPQASSESLLATGYKVDGAEVSGKYHIYPEQAAAGLWTNPTDLCKYIIETQLSYNGKSAKVLSPEMTRLRLKTVIDDAALGTFVNSRVTGSYKYFNHNGGNEGFCCTAIGCLNSGDGVVIMTNTDYNNNFILEEIANSVATVYKWKDYYLPQKLDVISPGSNIIEKYEGSYYLDGRKFLFVIKDGELLANLFADQYWKVYFTSDTEFYFRETKGKFHFLLNHNDTCEGFAVDEFIAKKL
jgi:CubicO group peptidase (beta-lactamase class C family)